MSCFGAGWASTNVHARARAVRTILIAPRRKILMSLSDREPLARRLILRQIGGTSGAALAVPALLGGFAASPASGQDAAAREAEGLRSSSYLSLGPQEAACVEALVNMMCPADGM